MRFQPTTLALGLVFLLANAAFAAQRADWTVFPVEPCALADVTWSDAKTLELAARGPQANLSRQGGDPKGCGIPSSAEGLLVDVLIDSPSAGRLLQSPAGSRGNADTIASFAGRGLTARQAVLELCRPGACKSDLALSGAQAGARTRIFVRGYLLRGEKQATYQGSPADLARRRESRRVLDCQTVVGPDGTIVGIGRDCGLDYGGVSRSPGRSGDDRAGADLEGCPKAYFPQSEWTDEPTRFAFPVEQEEWIAPAPIHYDRNRAEGANELACQPYSPGLLCYDNHEGTDFSLIGGFFTMDQASVYAVAAAPGIVTKVVDGHFDRCQVDLGPVICDTGSCYQTILGTVCPPCQPNPMFGKPYCSEGGQERDYDGLSANKVVICHADGTRSGYLHLMKDSILVEEGDRVECGTRLALIGSSGRSSAPHLHFNAHRPGDGAESDPFDANPDAALWVDPPLPGLLPGTACQGN